MIRCFSTICYRMGNAKLGQGSFRPMEIWFQVLLGKGSLETGVGGCFVEYLA